MIFRTYTTYIICLLGFVLLFSCNKKNDSQTAQSNLSISLENDANLYSVVISKEDKIVYEEYFNSKTKDSLCHIQSVTKSIISILMGIAIDEGYIKSIDETIEQYFPSEFNQLKNINKKNITIRHLLNQTSGLAWKGYLEHSIWQKETNPDFYVLNKILEHEPGEFYNYNSGATHLLSVIISRATGRSTLEFANETLFKALSINILEWDKTTNGYYDGSGLGLKMRPIDVLKIGQLIEHKGLWDGKQAVSEDWIQKMSNTKLKLDTKWGLKNSKHGLCWYESTLNGEKIYYAMGYGGQFLFIIPNTNLVIVSTHNHDITNGIEQQSKFLKNILPQLIKTYGVNTKDL
jgi:CubicO group peptidase (beta-lactamase class C family)